MVRRAQLACLAIAASVAFPTLAQTLQKDTANKPGETPAVLQELFRRADAYRLANPPGLEKCAFYATRAAELAPDSLKPQFQRLARYCYAKQRGTIDGYDTLVAIARANVDPPPGFSIPRAAPDSYPVSTIMRTPADPSTLSVSDKEYVLHYGSPDEAGPLWSVIQGKTVQLSG